MKKQLSDHLGIVLGLIHWLTTFLTERLILQVAFSENIFNYLVCKAILLVVLVAFWRMLAFAVCCPQRQERQIILYALPYLVILTAWLLWRHPMELVSDELNLFERATRLDSFAYWFNYPSGFYWIMGIMVIPHHMGPVLIKMLLQSLTAGYCITRQARITGKKNALLLYLLFLLPFVLDQGISAHRLPTYGMLYLFLMAKLIYDRLENKTLDTKTILLLGLICGILGIWRTEGIYLLPLGFILLVCAYQLPRNRQLWKTAVIYILALLVALLPQVKGYTVDSDISVSLRSKPLCGYVLCNMFRNGLTEEMVADEREDLDGYLKVADIQEHNRLHGYGNYESATVMAYADNEADYETQERFVDAFIRIVLKHPFIYLRSQLGAFVYTTTQYRLEWSLSPGAIAHNLMVLSSCVWIPCILVAAQWVWSIFKRRWLIFWLTAGGLANLAIVILMMPAAYAKYFYVDYLMGYYLLLVGICWLLCKRKEKRLA